MVPTVGPISGGNTVVISGSGFIGATAVEFDGLSATSFQVDSDQQITAVAPPHTAGAVPVTIRRAESSSAPSESSTYTYVGDPVVVTLSGVITEDTTIGPRFADTYVIDAGVEVAEGVTLRVEPGTVIKSTGGREVTFGTSGSLVVKGRLEAVGTAADPIVFTSAYDDTVGVPGVGLRSLEGQAPAAGDWSGIATASGDVVLEHVVGRYASRFVSGGTLPGGNGEAVGSSSVAMRHVDVAAVFDGVWGGGLFSLRGVEQVELVDVSISARRVGILATQAETASVVDSSVTVIDPGNDSSATSPTGVFVQAAGLVTMTGTDVSVTEPDATRYGLGVSLSGADAQVANNRITAVGVGVAPVLKVASEDLQLNELASNVIDAPDENSVWFSGKLTSSQTIATEPFQWVIDAGVEVAEGVTLRVEPGTVIKSTGGRQVTISTAFGLSITRSPTFHVAGDLEAPGTAADPIVFTSAYDDTVGVPGVGLRSLEGQAPAAGDWSGFLTRTSTIALSHASIRYANTGIELFGTSDESDPDPTLWFDTGEIRGSTRGVVVYDGYARVRASFGDNQIDLTSCEWNSYSCTVDATRSYWGSPDGPSPDRVCGSATRVAPWRLGPASDAPLSASSSSFIQTACGGTATPESQLAEAKASYLETLQQLAAQCDADAGACELVQTYTQCITAAVDLAVAQAPFPVSSADSVIADAAIELGKNELLELGTQVLDLADVSDFVVKLSTKMPQAAKAILDVATAYRSCPAGG